ncbi:hypothetical protein NsoK4_04215 [Nitrosopumilus sp. K4]|uniref:hypothetical protein n=1 Tax=Nitrosopumilus sp. K4 TaxID=2795383 RepID=UPI001BA9F352|nr:hypothetical protein [Nitrosopumilus sp. K4]QUC65456.1 hypothetical protein NsoK4_04215 [Nitrosopumilus sp. K4]
MKSKVDINSLSISKANPVMESFEKYDIQANIDEFENTENHSGFKYTFTILSQPKNVRIAVDGTIRVFGKPEERDAILDKNENDIPKILPLIYHELFPSFFMLSKSANVPCPPYQILTLGDETIPQNSNNVEAETETEPETIEIPESSKETVSGEPPITESTSDETTEKEGQTIEELQELYAKTSDEYSKNPSEELRKKLETISTQMNQKNSSSEPLESTV